MSKKVGVCIPSGGKWDTDFGLCLIDMLRWTQEKWLVYSTKSCLISKNRRVMVEDALKDGCTHILFIDTDMLFPKDTIEALLEHEQDVVAANCVTRKHPVRFTAQIKGEEVVTLPQYDGLKKVCRVGTGVMMINADVFRKIKKPWFAIGWSPLSNSELGEDYMFCQQCEMSNIDIYIDETISRRIRHMGYYSYGIEDYEQS